MSPVPMNILAYLAIIALIGLIGAVVWAGITVQAFLARRDRAVAMVQPPKDGVLKIWAVLRGIWLKFAQRGGSIAGHARAAAESVKHASDEVGTAAGSIDFKGFKSSTSNAADSLKSVTQVVGLLQKALDIVRAARG